MSENKFTNWLHKELKQQQSEKIKRELEFKNNQLETLIKVIKSQEEEIYQLKKQDYTQSKRRAWHY